VPTPPNSKSYARGMKDPALEAVADVGRRTRKPLPQGLWVVSIALAVVCVLALAVGLVESWNVKPRPHAVHSSRKIP
jgi:hypothetical protein